MTNPAHRSRSPGRLGRAVFFTLGCLILPAVIVFQCQRATPPTGVLDAGGTLVPVPAYPTRIVSLLPSVTEALFRLGAGERVVGVTTNCNRPPEARTREKAGSYTGPLPEKILALQPDLVLVGMVGRKEPIYRLREIGTCIFVLPDMNNFSEIREGYLLLGKLIGAQKKARRDLRQVEARLAEVRRRLAGRKPVGTFVEVGVRPLFTAGQGSMIDDILRHAGATNVAATLGNAYFRVDTEQVLSLNPEAVLVTTMDGIPDENRKRWLRFRSLAAARAGRVFVMNADDLCRPDPFAFATAVETVAKLLHPDAFKE
ncbi:MAG: ABC transporter substrate-binding protein [Planctomycetota bacterium]